MGHFTRSSALYNVIYYATRLNIIPCLHDQANIEQLTHTSRTCILNACAKCLLDDCSMFAWSCKRGIRV